MISTICKVTAVVLGILGFIGAIINSNNIITNKFSFALFLTQLVSVLVFTIIIYAVGEIIDLLQKNNSYLYEKVQILKKIQNSVIPEEQKNSSTKTYTQSTSIFNKPKIVGNNWICPSCNDSNSLSQSSCKTCGKYR